MSDRKGVVTIDHPVYGVDDSLRQVVNTNADLLKEVFDRLEKLESDATKGELEDEIQNNGD